MTGDAVVVDVSRDWVTGCDVQERFMRGLHPAIDRLDYSARCRQLVALGGDCYDFVPLPDHRLSLAVGDASGKGLAAALMMANVQSSLRTAAFFVEDDLSTLFKAVNRQVHASSLADRYATLFYGVFDGATRTLRYVNAGHNPPLIVRRDGTIIRLGDGGAPVGLFPDAAYEQGVIRLHPRDLLVAYTDGVIEAADPAGQEWGIEGLQEAVAESGSRCARDIVDAIFTSMDEFSRGRQTDDVTVAVVRVR